MLNDTIIFNESLPLIPSYIHVPILTWKDCDNFALDVMNSYFYNITNGIMLIGIGVIFITILSKVLIFFKPELKEPIGLALSKAFSYLGWLLILFSIGMKKIGL